RALLVAARLLGAGEGLLLQLLLAPLLLGLVQAHGLILELALAAHVRLQALLLERAAALRLVLEPRDVLGPAALLVRLARARELLLRAADLDELPELGIAALARLELALALDRGGERPREGEARVFELLRGHGPALA